MRWKVEKPGDLFTKRRWFAWYPVRVKDQKVWFEWVVRQRNRDSLGPAWMYLYVLGKGGTL